MRGGHHKVWPPGLEPSTSADAAGYPAMYLRLKLAWQRGAAPYAAPGGAAALCAPLTFAAPTPEAVKILSRPTAQRTVGLRELLSARRCARPGVFLLSTPEGLLTDIEAELRGRGGVLLAHLALPLPHVLRLRGALRAKHAAEGAAAAAAAAKGRRPPAPVPLAEYDLGAAAAAAALPRLDSAAARAQGHAVIDGMEALEAAAGGVVSGAQRQLKGLALEQAAWRARREIRPGGGERGGGGGGERGGRLPAPRYDARRPRRDGGERGGR